MECAIHVLAHLRSHAHLRRMLVVIDASLFSGIKYFAEELSHLLTANKNIIEYAGPMSMLVSSHEGIHFGTYFCIIHIDTRSLEST